MSSNIDELKKPVIARLQKKRLELEREVKRLKSEAKVDLQIIEDLVDERDALVKKLKKANKTIATLKFPYK